MLRELAPLLAEEGIDVDNIDVPDLETLQAGDEPRGRTTQHARCSPRSGAPATLAVATLRLAVEAIADGDTAARRDSPRPSPARIARQLRRHRRRLHRRRPRPARRLADRQRHRAPAGLGRRPRCRAGHWTGERAATDILALADKGRAFRSLDSLIARQGGQHVLYGSALALAAAVRPGPHRPARPYRPSPQHPALNTATIPDTNHLLRRSLESALPVWLPAMAWRSVIMSLRWWSGAGSNRRPSAFQADARTN